MHGRLHLSWQAQYFVDLDAKAAETRNPLLTLCLSDRSRCGAVRLLISSRNRLGTLCVSDRPRGRSSEFSGRSVARVSWCSLRGP